MTRAALAISIALFAMAAQANAQFGPSEPRTDAESRFSLGAGVRNDSSTWTYGYDVAFSRAFSEGSLYVAPGWELFARVGGSNYVVNDTELYKPGWTWDLSNVGYQFFASGGARGLLWQAGDWSVGSTISCSRFSAFDKSRTVEVNAFQTVFVDAPLEIEFGAPLTWQFGQCGQYSLYAGPAVHFGYVEGDVRTTTFSPSVEEVDEIHRLNVRDKGSLAAFVGLQTPLFGSGGRLQLEGQIGAGVGGSLSAYWAF